jgi:hypothetical protein
MSYSPEVTEAASRWMVHHRATEDPEILARIVNRAQENLERLGGYISPAHFERAYLELVSEGVIKPFRGSLLTKPDAAPAIPQEIIDWIENPRVGALEQRKRYANDPVFKKQYDLYANQQLEQRVAQEQNGVLLTVEEYRLLPAAVVAQRYHKEKGFRVAVDALIARGKI